MYDKEIVNAICENHSYEYFVASKDFEVSRYSKHCLRYCDEDMVGSGHLSLFDVAPELVGTEDILHRILAGSDETFEIPFVWKSSETYVNIYVKHGTEPSTLLVLFEDVTQSTNSQHYLRQMNNENLLFLEEIADKNRQLKAFNQEMQTLVELEVAKNLEKQHMLELQTRHAQMGEMIAMITHQWKQPLSVIQTIGTVLKIKYELGTLDKALFAKKLDTLLSQATYLNQTVNDFQTFFKPSKEKVLFNVGENVASLLGFLKEEFTLFNITIVFNMTFDISVYGYENEYKQVLLAILQNAKDALLESEQTQREITIKIDTKEGRSLVCIEDNAGGIPEKILDTIFSQYMTTKEKGSGLGLHIAKSVIENNMHGKLWVENTKVGACFYIEV